MPGGRLGADCAQEAARPRRKMPPAPSRDDGTVVGGEKAPGIQHAVDQRTAAIGLLDERRHPPAHGVPGALDSEEDHALLTDRVLAVETAVDDVEEAFGRYLPVTRTISVVVVMPRKTFSMAASRRVRMPSSRAVL